MALHDHVMKSRKRHLDQDLELANYILRRTPPTQDEKARGAFSVSWAPPPSSTSSGATAAESAGSSANNGAFWIPDKVVTPSTRWVGDLMPGFPGDASGYFGASGPQDTFRHDGAGTHPLQLPERSVAAQADMNEPLYTSPSMAKLLEEIAGYGTGTRQSLEPSVAMAEFGEGTAGYGAASASIQPPLTTPEQRPDVTQEKAKLRGHFRDWAREARLSLGNGLSITDIDLLIRELICHWHEEDHSWSTPGPYIDMEGSLEIAEGSRAVAEGSLGIADMLDLDWKDFDAEFGWQEG